MSFFEYLWGTVWREVGNVTRAVQFATMGVPALIAAIIVLFGGEWSKDLWPAQVWAYITVALAICVLFYGVTKRGYFLEKEKEPKIIVKGFDVIENSGEQCVRVRIFNDSTSIISRARAKMIKITDKVGVFDKGHKIDKAGNRLYINFPCQLFTSERLKERLDGGAKYARRFDLDPKDCKLIEILQVKKGINTNCLVYDAAERHDLLPTEDATFSCQILSGGIPVEFNVVYEAIRDPRPGFKITLNDGNGAIIEGKTFYEVNKGQGFRDE